MSKSILGLIVGIETLGTGDVSFELTQSYVALKSSQTIGAGGSLLLSDGASTGSTQYVNAAEMFTRLSDLGNSNTTYTTIEMAAGTLFRAKIVLDWRKARWYYSVVNPEANYKASEMEWATFFATNGIVVTESGVIPTAGKIEFQADAQPPQPQTWKCTMEADLANRQVRSLPNFGAGFLAVTAGKRVLQFDIVAEDNLDIIPVTPTPDPGDGTTVSGVKISNLNAVPSLKDDDLFVLSQDDPSGGTYDASYNVTLSTLKTNIDGAGGWSSGWSAAAGNNTSTPYSHTLNSTDVVWQIYVADNDEGLNAIALDVQLDLQTSQNDTLGALLSDVTTTSFNLQLGGGYFATLKLPQATINFSTKFVKVVGRRS